MNRWLLTNVAAALTIVGAFLFFFGELTIWTRGQFLHTTALLNSSGFAELAFSGGVPLFGYVAISFLIAAIIYPFPLLFIFRSRSSIPRSRPDLDDVRSSVLGRERKIYLPNPLGQVLRQGKRHVGIWLLLIIVASLHCEFERALKSSSNLILAPANGVLFWNLQLTPQQFEKIGSLGTVLAFMSPIFLIAIYVVQRRSTIRFLIFNLQIRSWIAIETLFAFLLFATFSAEYRGFHSSLYAHELVGRTGLTPELIGKRLFLLGENANLYAILVSQPPSDARSIVFIRPEKVPFLIEGRFVCVLEPIR